MTDNEIIKALECCERGDCYRCPANKFGGGCTDKAKRLAIYLINRQKAEIERLNKQLVFEIESAYDRGMKSGVKEFVEALKSKYGQVDILCPRRFVALTYKELDEFVNGWEEHTNV